MRPPKVPNKMYQQQFKYKEVKSNEDQKRKTVLMIGKNECFPLHSGKNRCFGRTTSDKILIISP
jgi:hypothetical protein